MQIDQAQILELVKTNHIFRGLSETDLESLIRRFGIYNLAENERVIKQGSQGSHLFFVFSGSLQVWQQFDDDIYELSTLEPGDFFGEEEILYKVERQTNITTTSETTLLFLKPEDVQWLLKQYPTVKQNLRKAVRTRRKNRNVEYDWLGQDENVHLIARRHQAELWFNLIQPLGVLVFGAALHLFTPSLPTPTSQFISQISAYFFTGFSIIWAIWKAVDYRNDYFIITNQRVVWLEEILLQSASRVEAPLTTIQSIKIRTSMLGRWLGYGTVSLRTITGSMSMSFVSGPLHMKALIEELVVRYRKKNRHARHNVIRNKIRDTFGFETVEEGPVEVERPSMEPVMPSPLSLFKSREIDGDVITYHKHWIDLLRKIMLHLLLTIIIGSATIWFSFNDLVTPEPTLPTLTTALLIGGIGIMVPMIMLVYNFADWQNDVYKITADSIIDSERKPLGDEITKSAPIKNILSLQHQREGIIGLIFNFGTVTINVGDTTLDFLNVSNPALVQQDIFYRMDAIYEAQKQAELDHENEVMTEWLTAYHDILKSQENDLNQSDTGSKIK